MAAGICSTDVCKITSKQIPHIKKALEEWEDDIHKHICESVLDDPRILVASYRITSIESTIEQKEGLVAFDLKRVIHGIAIYTLEDSSLYVNDLVISPRLLLSVPREQNGLGRKMMIQLYETAKKVDGISQLHLHAPADSWGFYRKLGMQELEHVGGCIHFMQEIKPTLSPFVKEI